MRRQALEKGFPARDSESEKKAATPLAYALDIVSGLGESGLTVVPIKPTAEMLIAGSEEGDVTVETVWRIYQAMVSRAE